MADPVRLRLDVQTFQKSCGSCDIVELPSRQILAAFNRGDALDNGKGDVVGKIALDYDGLKWPDEPFPILTRDSEQKIDPLTVSVRNPTLLRLKNGKVGLIYMATRRMVANQTEPQLSDLFIRTLEHDRPPDAINWSDRVGITTYSEKGLYGHTHSAAAVLADGTLLVAPWYQLHDNSDQAPAESEGVLVFISQDHGAKWRKTDTKITLPHADVNLPPGRPPTLPTEAKVTQLYDGSLLMGIRPTCALDWTARAVYLSYSSVDGGINFSPPEPRVELPSPSAPNVVRPLPGTPDLIVIWNNCVPCWTVRTVDGVEEPPDTMNLSRNWLSSALSRDGGKTWENHKVIDSGFDDQDHQLLEIAYPSCTFIRNKAYISYYKTSMNPKSDLTPQSLELVVVPQEWFYER